MPTKCPTCKNPADEQGKFFPFCSDRCRLIDLGRWLDGKYQIPVAEPDEADEIESRQNPRQLDPED